MLEKKYTWHKIADTISSFNFSAESIAVIQIDSREYCIVLFKAKLFACAASCPHAGGKLKEGYIDALGNIVCPLHHYKFNITQERNVPGHGYLLAKYPVEQTENGIFIGLPGL